MGKKKVSTRKSTMRWIEICPKDAKLGDYVKGMTWTNSQKHGDDYNGIVRGTVQKESSKAEKIKIITSKGKKKNVCRFVGTSGDNAIFKAVDIKPPGFFKLLFKRQLTGKKSNNSNISSNKSVSSSNASSISSNGSRSSRSRSRSSRSSRSSSRSRSRGGKSTKKNCKNNK